MSFNVYFTDYGDLWTEEVEDAKKVTFNFIKVTREKDSIEPHCVMLNRRRNPRVSENRMCDSPNRLQSQLG